MVVEPCLSEADGVVACQLAGVRAERSQLVLQAAHVLLEDAQLRSGVALDVAGQKKQHQQPAAAGRLQRFAPILVSSSPEAGAIGGADGSSGVVDGGTRGVAGGGVSKEGRAWVGHQRVEADGKNASGCRDSNPTPRPPPDAPQNPAP